MKLKQMFVWICAALFFAACHTANSDNSYLKPNISGKVNEVIVVINKSLWDTPLGDSLFHVLTQEIDGLPQVEPCFNVSDVEPASFENLASLRTFRNLLLVDIDKKYPKAKISVQKGKWAKQQLVVNLHAPNKEAFIRMLSTKAETIRDIIRKAEGKRIAKNYNKYANMDVMEFLKKHHQLTLTVPKNYSIGQKYEDFIWLSHETPEMSQGIFVYWYPYEMEQQLSKDSLLAQRNRFTQRYVPGDREGSYMTTDMKAPLSYKLTKTRGTFAAMMRGLWYTENDFMGGPFISISKVDEQRGRIVTAEGFVYAPKNKKRNYVQQLEEIIKTLRFSEADETQP